MSTQHTPGPWKVKDTSRPSEHTSRLSIVLASGSAIIAYPANGWPPNEMAANARLIAAAPELLEALQNAGALWAYSSTDAPQQAWLAQARAAIAKATEEQA